MAANAKQTSKTKESCDIQRGERGKFLKGSPGLGRPKGAINISTRELRDMFLGALDRLGGMEWLVTVAQDRPGDFLNAITKLLPKPIDDAEAPAPAQPNVVVFAAGWSDHDSAKFTEYLQKITPNMPTPAQQDTAPDANGP